MITDYTKLKENTCRTDYPLPFWTPCFIRHWCVYINYKNNFNNWHSRLENICCTKCGKTILNYKLDKGEIKGEVT